MISRWFLVLCLVSGLAQAQIAPALVTAITPSPLGIVITVGQWIVLSNNRGQAYEIVVEGLGTSPEQSRSNGYRLAVEQALGSLISSESQVDQGRLKRDEIIAYSSGYVQRFEILDRRQSADGTYHTTMRVWVGRSALADRLLASSTATGTVDGSQAQAQIQTLRQERETGDRLLATVLRDFPARSFDIAMSPTRIQRQGRGAVIEQAFVISWSQDYLRSLWAAVEATGIRTGSPRSVIGVNSGSIFGFGGQGRYDDTVKFELLYRSMVLTRPLLMIDIVDSSGTVLQRTCQRWQELDHEVNYSHRPGRFVEIGTYGATAFVNGAYRLRSSVSLPVDPATLDRVHRVNLAVVPATNCRN